MTDLELGVMSFLLVGFLAPGFEDMVVFLLENNSCVLIPRLIIIEHG